MNSTSFSYTLKLGKLAVKDLNCVNSNYKTKPSSDIMAPMKFELILNSRSPVKDGGSLICIDTVKQKLFNAYP